ncbi:MAG: hypothetical protein ACOCVF_03110 [bacterium]
MKRLLLLFASVVLFSCSEEVVEPKCDFDLNHFKDHVECQVKEFLYRGSLEYADSFLFDYKSINNEPGVQGFFYELTVKYKANRYIRKDSRDNNCNEWYIVPQDTEAEVVYNLIIAVDSCYNKNSYWLDDYVIIDFLNQFPLPVDENIQLSLIHKECH